MTIHENVRNLWKFTISIFSIENSLEKKKTT